MFLHDCRVHFDKEMRTRSLVTWTWLAMYHQFFAWHSPASVYTKGTLHFNTKAPWLTTRTEYIVRDLPALAYVTQTL